MLSQKPVFKEYSEAILGKHHVHGTLIRSKLKDACIICGYYSGNPRAGSYGHWDGMYKTWGDQENLLCVAICVT